MFGRATIRLGIGPHSSLSYLTCAYGLGFSFEFSFRGTCFSGRALAVVGADAVVARAAVEAQSLDTVVDVDLTVYARPAVDADAQVAAGLVVTRGAVLTRAQRSTLVHVHRTVATYTSTSPRCKF